MSLARGADGLPAFVGFGEQCQSAFYGVGLLFVGIWRPLAAVGFEEIAAVYMQCAGQCLERVLDRMNGVWRRSIV